MANHLSQSRRKLSIIGWLARSFPKFWSSARKASLNASVYKHLDSNPFLPETTVSLVPGTGYLNYDRQQNISFYLGYGKWAKSLVGGDPVLLNVDLTAGGADRFALTLSAAPGAFSILISVADNTFFENSGQEYLSGDGPGTYYLSFSEFSGVDFEKIGSIGLQTGLAGPGEYRFDDFRTASAVPEPATYGIVFGLALAAYALRRGILLGDDTRSSRNAPATAPPRHRFARSKSCTETLRILDSLMMTSRPGSFPVRSQ